MISFVLEGKPSTFVAQVGLDLAPGPTGFDLRMNGGFRQSDSHRPQTQIGFSRGIHSCPDEIDCLAHTSPAPQSWTLTHQPAKVVKGHLGRPMPLADGCIADLHQFGQCQIGCDGKERGRSTENRKVQPCCRSGVPRPTHRNVWQANSQIQLGSAQAQSRIIHQLPRQWPSVDPGRRRMVGENLGELEPRRAESQRIPFPTFICPPRRSTGLKRLAIQSHSGQDDRTARSVVELMTGDSELLGIACCKQARIVANLPPVVIEHVCHRDGSGQRSGVPKLCLWTEIRHPQEAAHESRGGIGREVSIGAPQRGLSGQNGRIMRSRTSPFRPCKGASPVFEGESLHYGASSATQQAY